MMNRRSFLAGLAGTAALSTLPHMATAKRLVSASASFAEVNVNWHGYSDGKTAEGFDLTWATGTGSSRRYIRAQRLADYLRTKVQASLYFVIECDETMAADLCHLMGSQWKYLGCVDEANDKNGWLYDSGKWSPGSLAVTILPGGGNRRLLAAGFTHKATGVLLPCAVWHLSSNAPLDRAAQIDAVLDASEGKNRLAGADLNASSPATGDCSDGSAAGPRTQLDCRGWEGYGETVGGFQNYDSDYTELHIDYIGVSKAALASGKISIRNETWFDTRSTMATDHCVLKASVDFNSL